MKSCTAAAVLLLLCSSPTLAQPVLAEALAQWRASEKCTYARCALSIAPAWNGLDVVSGSSGTRVTGLGFFWPRRAGAPFAGNDSASMYVERAFHVRRAAAAFTDAGVLMLGYAALRQLRGGFDERARAIGVIGMGAFAVGRATAVFGGWAAQSRRLVAQCALCAVSVSRRWRDRIPS